MSPAGPQWLLAATDRFKELVEREDVLTHVERVSTKGNTNLVRMVRNSDQLDIAAKLKKLGLATAVGK